MVSGRFRRKVHRVLGARQCVKLAVFGPGKGRPFYEKRLAAVDAIRREFPEVEISYDPIDERVPQSSKYEDYPTLRNEEIRQVLWADIILILINHHRLTAITEVALCREAGLEDGQTCMRKVGIAAVEELEISSVTFNEWQWQLGGEPQRIRRFAQPALDECRVARELLVDMFMNIAVELWGSTPPV